MSKNQEFIALSPEQVSEFFHDEFVQDQTRHFTMLVQDFNRLSDLGGGVGHFAKAISEIYHKPVQVIDLDNESLRLAKENGLEVFYDDIIQTRHADKSDIVSLNLVLHHLVGGSQKKTDSLQVAALSNQANGKMEESKLFINEYVYESYISDEFASWAIFSITSSSFLSTVARQIGRFVPSLKANTLGVGVRFHSLRGWIQLFERAGWKVERHIEGQPEMISVPRRLSFALKSCRRDSFILSR